MKNILWFIVLILVIYIMLIFIKPSIANNIAEIIWIKSFNEKVLDIKEKMDYFSTKIPTKEELDEAYSWAKNKIEDVKENIDNIRESADKLEDKYNEAKDFIDETWDKIDKVKENLNDLEKIWDDISNAVNKQVME